MSQKENAWELIITDDGSTDNTLELISEFTAKPNVKLVQHPKNKGVNVARNSALDVAKGEWVVILDSDNQLSSDALVIMRRTAEENSSLGMMKFSVCNKQRVPISPQLALPTQVAYGDILSGRMSGEFHTLVRRDLLDDIRFLPNISGGEGITWKLILKKTGACLFSPEYTLIYDDEGDDRLSNRTKNYGRLATVFKEDLKRLWLDYLRYAPKQFLLKVLKYIIYSSLSILDQAKHRLTVAKSSSS